MKTIANIPANHHKRIVIVGGGFAGLKLAKSLRNSNFQVVLLDKNNYHQFQPLFYQVATAGLEPSAITFPLRKVFQHQSHIHFRMGELQNIAPEKKVIVTGIGQLPYDYLVIAIGANTNFFGNKNIEQRAIPMKSLNEAIQLRNTILLHLEQALTEQDQNSVGRLLNIAIAGGGPTGVELAGALAEMRSYILPKDYPELDFSRMKIYLLEASPKVLNGYSEPSSKMARQYLERLGVEVRVSTLVEDYDGEEVRLGNGGTLPTDTLIWAAGIKGNEVKGLPPEAFGQGGRILVNEFNQVKNCPAIFAIGDIALMPTTSYDRGHPQVATVAIQQAALLRENFESLELHKPLKPFRYHEKGSLATVGRNLAVADLPGFRLQGFFAWILWLFVHLMEILGVKNKLFVFINWAWSYFTLDQSLRLLIRPERKGAVPGKKPPAPVAAGLPDHQPLVK